MSYALTLDVPENVYEMLLKIAEQIGQRPETLAVQCLKTTIQNYEIDPLEKFIGAFKSNIPDWADEHDKYLGQSAMETNATN